MRLPCESIPRWRNVVDRGRPAAGRGTAPTRPEDQRDQQAGRTDDHQDHADRVDVDPRDPRVDGPGENRTNRNQDQTDSDTHFNSSLVSLKRALDARGEHLTSLRL